MPIYVYFLVFTPKFHFVTLLSSGLSYLVLFSRHMYWEQGLLLEISHLHLGN